MGDKTRAQLMGEAGLAASNDQGQPYIRTFLDNWLTRTAKTWSWPVLKKRVLNLPIALGAARVAVGRGASCSINGQTLTTHYVHKLLGGYVLWRAQSGFSPYGRANVRPLLDANPDNDADLSDPLARKGTPATVKVRQTDNGALSLELDPTPDRAMYLNFDVHWVPPSLGSTPATDGLIPWYPNDRTLVQVCKCALIEMDTGGEGDPEFDSEMAKLAGMVVDDRDFDGDQAGDDQVMGLDPSVFRPTGR
jgi:hypothetical protein